MTTKQKQIKKIKDFFKKSRVKSFDLTEIDATFTLDEGDLYDTQVNIINEGGVDTDGYGVRMFDELDSSDIKYIVGILLPQLKKAEPEIFKQQTIDRVIEQIKEDIQDGDVEAIDELLSFVPIENLVGYLPERIKFT